MFLIFEWMSFNMYFYLLVLVKIYKIFVGFFYISIHINRFICFFVFFLFIIKIKISWKEKKKKRSNNNYWRKINNWFNIFSVVCAYFVFCLNFIRFSLLMNLLWLLFLFYLLLIECVFFFLKNIYFISFCFFFVGYLFVYIQLE